MGARVERLWQIARRRLDIANRQVRREMPFWGRDGSGEDESIDGRPVSREEIEQSLSETDGAYRRLRRVMDAWCALWFWPLTEEEVEPPTLEQWYDALGMIVGRNTTKASAARQGQDTLDSATTWDQLDDLEHNDRVFAGASMIKDVLTKHPWLSLCESIAERQGFFHWTLEFAPVFAHGGFDLQAGNPPWVRPEWNAADVLAEFEVRFALEGKMAASRQDELKATALLDSANLAEYSQLAGDQIALREAVSSPSLFPHLVGLRPDLYRCFMEQTWAHQSRRGVTGLVHPETHFTDEKAGLLRAVTYSRLRRHWQFVNELVLFEIDHHVSFGIHVYGRAQEPRFLMATSLYHPDTVARSLKHDGSGEEPGLKDAEGNWDLRPHKNRILHGEIEMLSTWHAILESDAVPVMHTRMVYAVNRASAAVLDKLAHRNRLGELGLYFSQGWNETTDFRRGYFAKKWGAPDSWDGVILQGPHFHVGVPFYKAPNATMANNLDWSPVDLESLESDAVPLTTYKPRGRKTKYDADYSHWLIDEEQSVSVRDYYRVAWRRMAANTGERTLIPAIVPPGAAHVHPVHTFAVPGHDLLTLLAAGFTSSLVHDFSVRSVGKSEILFSAIRRMPWSSERELAPELALRTLRLNCLTHAYADLWNQVAEELTVDDAWTGGIDYPGRPGLGAVTKTWTSDMPLRRASDRRQALVEIDALVALMLGLTADELSTIYRTQFAVLYGYDRNTYYYDANGRLVPTSVLSVWRKKGDAISEDERTTTNASENTYTYELPYRTLDREADMRQAYAQFEKVLEERS
jgi:hypothetical protein